MTNTNGTHGAAAQPDLTTEKRGLAQMLKGGVMLSGSDGAIYALALDSAAPTAIGAHFGALLQ